MGDVHSEFLSISKGVPQGLVIGPLLLNELYCPFPWILQLHADHTILYCKTTTLQPATESLFSLFYSSKVQVAYITTN